MDDEKMLEYINLCDRMDELQYEMLFMRTLLLGMLDVYEHECIAAIRFIPDESSDIISSFTTLATSLYHLYDKLDSLCYPESA